MSFILGLLTAKIYEIVMLQTLKSLELAAHVKLLGSAVEVLGTGVSVIVAAKDLDGLLDSVLQQSASWLGFGHQTEDLGRRKD